MKTWRRSGPATGPIVPPPWTDGQLSPRQPVVRCRGGNVVDGKSTLEGIYQGSGRWLYSSKGSTPQDPQVSIDLNNPSSGLILVALTTGDEYSGTVGVDMKTMTLQNGELGGVVKLLADYQGEPGQDVWLYFG